MPFPWNSQFPYAQTQADVLALIRDDAEAPEVTVTQDDFGFTWREITVGRGLVLGLLTGSVILMRSIGLGLMILVGIPTVSAGGPYTVPISINNASRLSAITVTVSSCEIGRP